MMDYSAPVRRLFDTVTDPDGFLGAGLNLNTYTDHLSFVCRHAGSVCEAATHAGLNIVSHCRLFLTFAILQV